MSQDILTPVTPRWLFVFDIRVTSIRGKCWTRVRLWGKIEESEKSSVVRNLTQVNLDWAPSGLPPSHSNQTTTSLHLLPCFKCGTSCSKQWTLFRSWVRLQCVHYSKTFKNPLQFQHACSDWKLHHMFVQACHLLILVLVRHLTQTAPSTFLLVLMFTTGKPGLRVTTRSTSVGLPFPQELDLNLNDRAHACISPRLFLYPLCIM